MTLPQLSKTALIGLSTHKSRSLLTILGIVIGITAIILVMSMGQAAQNLILGEIQSIGAKILEVNPGRQPTGPADFYSVFADSLKQRELDALKSKGNVPHSARIMPTVVNTEVMSYGNETYRPTIFGGTEAVADIYDVELSEGRMFTADEVRSYADVVIIGNDVRKEFFENENPLDKKIRIKGRNFRVIGLISAEGQSAFFNLDKAAIVPYTTAQSYIFGQKHFSSIVIEVDEEANVERTMADINFTLRNLHDITDPAKDDFFIQSSASAIETVGMITSVLTLFLAAVAAISLVVGGIGIMNIMLVSVTERTQEIGLRKALGATNRNIMTQFLIEAVMLTGTGGVIGITFGALFAWLGAVALSQGFGLDWEFVLPLSAVALGLGVSSGIGLIFGLYPARQAAKKSPIEALRYE